MKIEKEVFHLENEHHFDLLADPTRLQMIELLYHPRSVGELAEALGVPRTRLYHHVNQLDEAGMIRVVDTRKSGAVDEKIYQTAAQSFQPSPEYMETAIPREQAMALTTAIFGSTQADFIRAVDEGTAELRDDKSSRSIHIHRGLAFLTPGQLHEFVTALEELMRRFDTGIDDPADIPADAIPVATLNVVYPTSRGV